MNYEQFSKIFNERIFRSSKKKLIKNIADHPEQYTGLFKPIKLKNKKINLKNFIKSFSVFGLQSISETTRKKSGVNAGYSPMVNNYEIFLFKNE